jgi:Na+/phosphate symporter
MAVRPSSFLLRPRLTLVVNCLLALFGLAHLVGVFPPGVKGPNLGALISLVIVTATIASLAMRRPPRLVQLMSMIGNALIVLVGIVFFAFVGASASAPFWAFASVALLLVFIPFMSALAVFMRWPRSSPEPIPTVESGLDSSESPESAATVGQRLQ